MSHNYRNFPGTSYFKFVHSMLSKLYEMPSEDTSKTRKEYIKLNILHQFFNLLRDNVGRYYRVATLLWASISVQMLSTLL